MLTWYTHTAHDAPRRHNDAWFWHTQKLKNILFKQVLKLFTLELKYILYFFETYFKIINFSFHSIFKTRKLFFKTLSFERIVEHDFVFSLLIFGFYFTWCKKIQTKYLVFCLFFILKKVDFNQFYLSFHSSKKEHKLKSFSCRISSVRKRDSMWKLYLVMSQHQLAPAS